MMGSMPLVSAAMFRSIR